MGRTYVSTYLAHSLGCGMAYFILFPISHVHKKLGDIIASTLNDDFIDDVVYRLLNEICTLPPIVRIFAFLPKPLSLAIPKTIQLVNQYICCEYCRQYLPWVDVYTNCPEDLWTSKLSAVLHGMSIPELRESIGEK